MPVDNFSAWPHYADDEIQSSFRVLQSGKVNYWTGNEGKLFEEEFAAYVGCQHAIAVSNGSVALQIALHGLGIGYGDDVVVTARTFVASVSSIVLSGAIPVFADVDLDSQNVTASTIEDVITPRTRAIICVHLAGWPCEMDEIMALANKRNIYVIEDCAQAHGATYKGRRVGSFGDVAAWSFCQDKIMSTAGEGGMITTNNTKAHRRMWSYKDHGKNYEKVHSKQNSEEGFSWLHDTIGTNYRMTEVQSAIGRLQLQKLAAWNKVRLGYAQQIWQAAQKHPLFRVPVIPDYIEHAVYKCYIFLNLSELKSGWDQNRVISEIKALGVPCFHGSCSEVYLEKAFENHSVPDERLNNCRVLSDTSLMFLVHPTLTQSEINVTCKTILEVAAMASKRTANEQRTVSTSN